MSIKTRILDSALSTCWAITEDGLHALREIYEAAAARSGTVTIEQLEAIIQQNEELGQSLHLQSVEALATTKGVRLEQTHYVSVFPNGVAVIDLIGPIYPRANMMTASGATSIQQFVQDFVRAYNDPNVKGIVLNVDSPGGDVRGIGAAAHIINKASKQGRKPVQAFASGYMASAAYYVASGVGPNNIFGDEASLTGSIGVVLTAKAKGEGEYEIVSSKSPNKRPDPATEEGRTIYQQQVDDLAAIFIRDVANFRGVSESKILTDYGQGAVVVGLRAKAAGLIDKTTTLSAVVEKMGKQIESGASTQKIKLEGSEALELLTNLNIEDTQDMKVLENFLSKFRASESTINEDDDQGQATESTEEEEGTGPAQTRLELAETFAEGAELFATQLVIAGSIFPSQQAYAATEFLNARIDDKLYGGTVDYITEEGQCAVGTREAALKARYAAMPKHSLTKKAIAGIKDGSVEAKILGESDKNDKEKEMTPERRAFLLGTTEQGRAVLAQSSKK